MRPQHGSKQAIWGGMASRTRTRRVHSGTATYVEKPPICLPRPMSVAPPALFSHKWLSLALHACKSTRVDHSIVKSEIGDGFQEAVLL